MLGWTKKWILTDKRVWMILLAMATASIGWSQVKVGDNPNVIGGSSVLELESTDKALLVSRLLDTSVVVNPTDGMIIYDLSRRCFVVHQNGRWSGCLMEGAVAVVTQATVTSLDCANATFSPGQFVPGVPYSGTLTINYTGGNGGIHNGFSVFSTGVTGLTASIAGGGINMGSGTLTFTITGTPAAAGTATFTISFGGQTCAVTLSTKTFRVLVHNEYSQYWPGGSHMPYLDDKLLNTSNFGPTGIYPCLGVTLTYSSSFGHTITAAELANYDVYIVCYQSDGSLSAAERTIIKNWVDNDGGVLFAMEDVASTNPMGEEFGIVHAGPSTVPWTIDVPGHPIFNNVFGVIGTSISTAGTIGRYQVTAGYTMLAYHSNATRPTIYSYDSGNAIFFADEAVIRQNVSTGNNITPVAGDLMWGNMMAWAFDQVP